MYVCFLGIMRRISRDGLKLPGIRNDIPEDPKAGVCERDHASALPSPCLEVGDLLILFGAGGGVIPYNRMLIFLYFRGCYFCFNKISICCLV